VLAQKPQLMSSHTMQSAPAITINAFGWGSQGYYERNMQPGLSSAFRAALHTCHLSDVTSHSLFREAPRYNRRICFLCSPTPTLAADIILHNFLYPFLRCGGDCLKDETRSYNNNNNRCFSPSNEVLPYKSLSACPISKEISKE
jgi:hypothetical protein